MRGWGSRLFSFLIFLGLALSSSISTAEKSKDSNVSFSIIQTSDIHSHFLNNDSPFQLGGIARLATEIQNLRQQKQNVLVLDAGDFTEGSIFYTLNHGLATFQIMQNIGYDALVLGNHEWLIGPDELYNSLNRAQFKLPILSANLDTTALDKNVALGDFIKPYIVKNIGGIKIGILGLSTFQFIFDPFFLPIRLLDPVATARKYVKELRSTEGCQVVIVLSHLGFAQDDSLAKQVSGIDLIIGGHTHVLFKKPYSSNGVPIIHVGKWGQYLGDFDFNYNGKNISLVNYQIHEITKDIPEDPYVKNIVETDMSDIEGKFGPLFHEKVLTSVSDLPLQDPLSEDISGHWAADALRYYTHTELAFENPSYVNRDIFQGDTTLADMFNIFPHIFNPLTNKAWTVKTFKLTGSYVQLLLDVVFRSGIYLRMSNAKAVLDLYRTIDQLYSLELAGQPVDITRVYTVAGTDGIVAAIDTLSSYGINVGISDLQDTGIEAWRMVADYFKMLSPITKDKLIWEGRVRTLQPDVVVRTEELTYLPAGPNAIALSIVVRNAGVQTAGGSKLSIRRANIPGHPLADRNVEVAGITNPIVIHDLRGGATQTIDVSIDITNLTPGRYPIVFTLTPAVGELETENNVLDNYFDVPEISAKMSK